MTYVWFIRSTRVSEGEIISHEGHLQTFSVY